MAQTTALDRARQRALDSTQPKESGLRNPSSVSQKPSGEFIQRPDGSRVPKEYFDLPREQQVNFDALLKEEESGAANESLALQYSKSVGDQQEAQAQRITALESQLADALDAVYVVQRRMDNIDTSVEVGKSDLLIEAQSDIAQQVTNLAAVKAEAESSATSIRRETEIQRLDHEQRLAAMEQPMAELEGRLKSSGTLYQEGIIANQNQLADVSAGVESIKVQLTELKGQTNAIGDPITRDELRGLVTSTVASEFPLQLPAMVSKELAIQKRTGELGEGIEIDRGYLAQSLENSDERSKRFEVSEQQIAEAQFTNPTERAVKRALKKRGRG